MILNLPQLARKTLKGYFNGKKFIPDKKTLEKYKEKQACFVTLTKNGNLRGCIGNLKARQELWKDVQENAINAAIHDFRFSGLTENELGEIKIEVSVLSPPKKLDAKNPEQILDKINKDMGIILKKGPYTATFLPQVWEQISDKITFLEQLSLKAGLNKDAWKNSEILYYKVIIEKED